MNLRALLLFAAMALFIAAVGWWSGAAFITFIMLNGLAYALIAIGLNIQWGYGGLFNFGIMGFIMLGGFAVTAVAYPVNGAFWESDGPAMLGKALLAFAVGAALVVGAWRLQRRLLKGPAGIALTVLAWIVAYGLYRSQIDPAASYIESEGGGGWVGGMGLHPLLGWAFGGVLAAGAAYIVGRISLGLRTDYLAIATIGISEIIRALLKNADWLTRGTLTVSPIPWPTPLPQDFQAWGVSIPVSFVYARLGLLAVVAVVLLIALVLVQRAYEGPWGRMMRAIRDNHIASASMGKDVKRRQLEIFVLGSVLIGIGGSMLTSINQIYDPGAYQPINYTFLLWVVVIVGGAGNNYGAILGALLIYVSWIVSDPLAQNLFGALSDASTRIGWGAIPEIETRSSQMRVFLLGFVIVAALRWAPQGLLPERIRRDL
ncbi:MAG: branched-chain amino acid ABC transporter permease [Cucumibacter sp.]